MNQISPRSLSSTAVVPAMPRTSTWLSIALRHYAAPTELPPLAMPPAAAVAVAREASDLLPILRRRMEPASPAQWNEFLRPLVAATRNPPGRDDFMAFVAAAAVALVGIPAHLLTPQRQAEAVRRFDFWPSVADVAKWLEPETREERAALGILERLAVAAEPAVAVADTRTPEIIAAVAGKMRAFKAEMQQVEEVMSLRASKAGPRHLSLQESIATMEQDIAKSGDPSGALSFLLQTERRKLAGAGSEG